MKAFALILAMVLVLGCTGGNRGGNNAGKQASTTLPVEKTSPPEAGGSSESRKVLLSDTDVEAMNWAIMDEYKAKATYLKVMKKIGVSRPFANIVEAEKQHISELNGLYEKYNIPAPFEPSDDEIPQYFSKTEACKAGVEAETENIELYDDLLSKVENQEVRETFIRLQKASRENHLPAFARCSQ